MENIKKAVEVIAKARKELSELEKKGLYSATVERGVHISFPTFVKHFTEFETEDRSCSDYRYQVSTSIDGVEVFAIAKEEAYKKAFPHTKSACELRIEELEKQLEAATNQGGNNL